MQSEKKCENCGKWTTWTQALSDTCEHCGELLQAEELTRISKIQQEEKEYQDNIFYHPKEGDGPFMFVTRKVAMVLHMVFAAITWAFMWFTVTFSG